MVLVDTSVWIDHLHRADQRLVRLLLDNVVVCHPLVIGELALGRIRDRATVLGLLHGLPQSVTATHAETLALIEHAELAGAGLSIVDVHLLASIRLTPGTQLWTRDRRLARVAAAHGIDGP